MMLKRREFLKTSTALAAGGLLLPKPSDAFFPASSRPVGLQLYTLFNVIDDDVAGTLKKVATIGYKEVESTFSRKGGYYGMKAKEFKKALKEAGLTWRSHHVPGAPLKLSLGAVPPTGPDGKPISFPPAKNLKENYLELVQEAAEGGIRYLVCASTPVETLEEVKRSIDVLSKAGEACAKLGITLAYHNHEREFQEVEGDIPYHLLLAQTDPAILKMELDIGWATKAGVDPVELFEKDPGRFPLWHVKDISSDLSTIEPVGSGSIDFKRIFAKARTAGLKHFFVEHDNPADPFGSITTSFDNLSKMVVS